MVDVDVNNYDEQERCDENTFQNLMKFNLYI